MLKAFRGFSTLCIDEGKKTFDTLTANIEHYHRGMWKKRIEEDGNPFVYSSR
jgi:hypothetical protein